MTITNNEIYQRAVGLLTLSRGTSWGEIMTDREESSFERGFISLRIAEDVLSGTINMAVPAECANAVQAAVKKATGVMVLQALKLAAGFVLAFEALADEYEAKCPDADVADVLRRVSLTFEEPPTD